METRRGISGSTLKLIAIITMLIDHMGAVVLMPLIGSQNGVMSTQNYTLIEVYTTMRMIGRVSFPIFCFLLVEGFIHTRDAKKYAIRLGAFAVISEIPFDLALTGTILESGFQNVFFTLFISLLVLMGLKKIEEMVQLNKVLMVLGYLGLIVAGGLIAILLATDYSMYGVVSVSALYLLRKQKQQQVIGGALSFAWELPAVLAFIPIWFYNGKRGINLKYLFYAFYPIHLLLLYFVSTFIQTA